MAGVLDMEMADLAGLLRTGVRWWLGELTAMASPLLRPGGAGRRRVAREASGGWRVFMGGRPAGELDGRPLSAEFELPGGAWLLRETAAAGLDEAEWRRVLMDDIDRLTPFEAIDVYVALAFFRTASGERRALVGVAPRAATDALLAEALEQGLRPTAVLGAAPDGRTLDFLPAIRSAGRFGRSAGSARIWWTMVALLLAANVGAAVWRDANQTARLEALAADGQSAASRIRRLQAQVGAERDRRAMVARQRADSDPLGLLARVSVALPQGAWAQRLSIQGADIRLAGRRRADIDVTTALKAHGFVDVHDAAVDLTPPDAATGNVAAFDVLLRAPPPSPGAEP